MLGEISVTESLGLVGRQAVGARGRESLETGCINSPLNGGRYTLGTEFSPKLLECSLSPGRTVKALFSLSSFSWKVAHEEGMTIGCGKLEKDSWMSNTPRVSWILAGEKASLFEEKTIALDRFPV